MRTRKIVSIGSLAVVLAVTAPWRAAAAISSPTDDLRGWTADSGVLAGAGSVLAISQDANGYLWLGTNRGLVRFDGSQFFRWGSHGEPALPGAAVRALICARDGSLWLTFTDAPGVARIQGDHLVAYTKQDGLPDGVMAAVLQDRSGSIWVGGVKGLARFDGSAWTRIGHESGFPEGEVNALYEDRSGNLWAGTFAGAFRKPAGKNAFEAVEPGSTYLQSFAEDRSGGMWVTHARQIVRKLKGREPVDYAPALRLPAASRRLFADSHGDIWVAAIGSLLRIRERPGGRMLVEPFLTASRAMGSIQTLFEDRERNLWVGMAGGLLRLSEGLVATDVPLDGLTTEGARALTVGSDGSVWVATTYGLNRFAGANRQVYKFKQTMALHTDPAGRVWVVTTDGIGRFDGDRFSSLVTVPLEQVSSITIDGVGDLWLCRRAQGLFRWRPSVPASFDRVPAEVDEPCSFVYADRKGRVWVGFGKSGVAVYNDHGARLFTEKEGLAGGSVTAMIEDRSGAIWISTVSGLSRFDKNSFTTMTEKNGLPSEIVRWMVEDDEGYLWVGVNGGHGIIRFNQHEIDQIARDPQHQIRYALYDESDGLPAQLSYWGRPAAVRGQNGRLWFATAAGVAVIDPHRAPTTRALVLPRIENAVADGRALAPLTQAALPPRTSTLQIDYAALSLSAASKLRFRYMLEGFSADWVYAGERRQTFYTNLPPGRYRFRVAATTDDLWKEPEATWAFSVRPAFYQTAWFYVLCATAVGSLVAAYWALSVRAVRNRYAVVVAERTRVSREIHDTLLQSLGAVGLELEVVASQLTASHSSTSDALRRLRRQVGECIAEARQSIWDLRSPSLERRDLGEAVRALAGTVKPGQAQVEVMVEGRPWSCPLEVQEELLRIGREAINNAVRHGCARSIQVSLEYRRGSLRLRVSDDGSGFNPAEVPTAGGHCGLLNMKERAARVGGRFTVTSQPGSGTVVEAVVPVASAA